MEGACGGLTHSASLVVPGRRKISDSLEMILHVQADTEELNVVGAHIP